MAHKGLRQLLFAQKNTIMNTVPTSMVAPGLQKDAALTTKEINITEYRGGELPYQIENIITANSVQTTFADLQTFLLVYLLEGGCDVQAVAQKSSSTTYDAVYNFTGDKRFMGFNFDYYLESKQRGCILTTKVNLDADEQLSLNQDSIFAVPRNLVTLGQGTRGVNYTKYRKPNLEYVASPINTLFVNNQNIVSRKLRLKSVGSELESGRGDVPMIEVTLEITINNTQSWELVNYLSKSKYASVALAERISPNGLETFNFGEGVLWRTHEFKHGIDNVYSTYRWKRMVSIHDIAIDTANNILTITE
jgi:hypothetical protein